MKDTFVQILKFILFFGFGFAILYLVYQKQNAAFIEQCALDGIPADECNLLLKIWTDFTQAKYFWLFMTCLAFMITNVFRALRWNILFEPLGYRPKFSNSFWSVMIGYFANLGLPRLGEVLRPGTLARYEKIPVEKALGTVVLERIIDMICLGIFTLIALSLEFRTIFEYLQPYLHPEGGQSGMSSRWLWIAAGVVLLFLLGRYLAKNDHPIALRVKKLLIGFWEGMKSIALVRRPIAFVLYTAGIWILYFGMNWLAFMAFAPTEHLGLGAALTVFIFGSLGIVIPSPGGMGTFHFLVTEALVLYGVSGEDGFVWANLVFFTIQIFCNIGFGLLALLFMPIINRGYRPPHLNNVSHAS